MVVNVIHSSPTLLPASRTLQYGTVPVKLYSEINMRAVNDALPLHHFQLFWLHWKIVEDYLSYGKDEQ